MHDPHHSLMPETGPLVKEAALAAMSAWVAAIANNIKNPVAGISAAADILARDLERITVVAVDSHESLDSSRATLERIQARLAQLNEYVTELVDFAKPPRVNLTEVNLALLVVQIRLTLGQMGFDSSSLEEAIAPEAQVVRADGGRLLLVLKSLVINSIEAVGSGKVARVRLSAQRSSTGGTSGVMLAVEDNGPGFYDKIITHIFDPFFSTKEASTGLGLTLVKKYVDAHGGTIMISSSRLLGGAKVEIFLPD